MRYRRPRRPDPPRLTALQQQRLDDWIAYLDVDLEVAQAAFREHDDYTMPPLPGEEPAPAPPLRGAYARRAAHATVTPVSTSHSD